MADATRPAKRQKTKTWNGGGGKGKVSEVDTLIVEGALPANGPKALYQCYAGGQSFPCIFERSFANTPDKAADKSKYRSNANGRGNISATGLHSGDVGVFVTCDKGKEKACLREMEDLLSEELGLDDETTADLPTAAAESAADDVGTPPTAESQNAGIEADIQRELAEMAGEGVVGGKRKRPAQNGNDSGSAGGTSKLGLVMLDIPCVSFVRFPAQSTHQPVDVVTKMCRDAKAHPERQRSRFIKRLTPLTKVRKVMSDGVEELCRDVLPAEFGAGDERLKYAVRVTVRNNNQIEKDQVIKTVAGAVRELGLSEGEDGESRHRVDLKGYDKLILVEIYRNVVGMSVVGAEWESLKRFNLSEIYGEGRAAVDKAPSVSRPPSQKPVAGEPEGTLASSEDAPAAG